MEKKDQNAVQWIQELYSVYYTGLCNVTRAYLSGVNQTHMAEEIVQDVMNHAFSQYEEIKDYENIKAWLYKNAYFRCSNLIRTTKRSRKRIAYSLDEEDAPEPVDRNAEREILECLDSSKSYQEAIDYLRENTSEADFLLFEEAYMKRNSTEELSRKYGISVPAMRMRISRLKKRMMKLLMVFLKIFLKHVC